MSLTAFIAHIAGTRARIEHETRVGLERSAKMIEAEAKREIGTYQAGAGPFAPWAELAESTLADKEKQGYAPPDNPLLREGDLRDSIGHAVGHDEAVVGSNSEVAVFQELGTEKMPPRSFLGGAGFRKAERVAEILGGSVAMGLVGERVVNGLLPISQD